MDMPEFTIVNKKKEEDMESVERKMAFDLYIHCYPNISIEKAIQEAHNFCKIYEQSNL